MPDRRPIQFPGERYSQEEELEFRRQIEEYLQDISYELSNVSSQTDKVSSAATKRNLFSLIPPGQSEFPSKEGSYFGGNVEQSLVSGTVAGGQDNWKDLGAGYGNVTSKDWAETGSDGDIEYSGAETRKFAIVYHGSFDAAAYLTRFHWRMRVQKDTGSGASEISGSIVENNFFGFQLSLNWYFMEPHMTGAIITEVSNGDKIRLQYSMAPEVAVTITVTYRTAPGSDGVQLAIFPVD